MDVTPQLIIALLVASITALSAFAGTAQYFRSDTKAVRREMDLFRQEQAETRASDQRFVQLQLQTIRDGIARVEKTTSAIAGAVNAARRAYDQNGDIHA